VKLCVLVRVSEAVTPLFTSDSQEIIVFEGETIEISCVVENIRK